MKNARTKDSIITKSGEYATRLDAIITTANIKSGTVAILGNPNAYTNPNKNTPKTPNNNKILPPKYGNNPSKNVDINKLTVGISPSVVVVVVLVVVANAIVENVNIIMSKKIREKSKMFLLFILSPLTTLTFQR